MSYLLRNRQAILLAAAILVSLSLLQQSRVWPFAPHLHPVSKFPVQFVDVAATAGLHYRWTIPGERPIDILQGIGNGCAFLDYDNDGNQDILLVGPKLALYRGDGHGHFVDVTQKTGLDRLSGRFLGCAVGDYDNDGYDDLYISGYHTGVLLHNEQGRFFKDVTKQSGLQPQPWGTSCAWGELSGDGRLDLYVCNYVALTPGTQGRLCTSPGSLEYIQKHGTNAVETTCGPHAYHALIGVLYRNLGGGKFRDVTAESGASATAGRGLGVAFAPFDPSGKIGFTVANDQEPGDLFRHQGMGQPDKLENIGVQSGIAYHHNGQTHAGMGIDWGDYDNDGRLDLFVATFCREAKDLYHNEGNSMFVSRSEPMSFGPAADRCVSFGCKWLDADNDGWLDLIMSNGQVEDNIRDVEPNFTYREPTLFYYNVPGKALVDATAATGIAHLPDIVGRGLATGDFDNDGRMDALVVDSEGAPLLLHNVSQPVGHWLRLDLRGTRSNQDGYGAIIIVSTRDRTVTRLCHADGSYLSSSDKRVHIGLGKAAAASSVIVRWPSGQVDRLRDLQADHEYVVTEGIAQAHLMR